MLTGFPRSDGRKGIRNTLVVAYLVEHYRSRTMVVLIFAKTLAFVFLGTCALFCPVPWAVGVSAVGRGQLRFLYPA